MTHSLKYPVVVEPLLPEDGGGFLATVPDLPGCMSDGETLEEAITNVQDAIKVWLEAASDLGHKRPAPCHSGFKVCRDEASSR
jgi:antitoxin HicB